MRGEMMVLNILATPIAALTRLRRLHIAGAAHELYHSSNHVDVDYDVSAAAWAPVLDKLTALTDLCLAGIGGGFEAAAALGPSIAKLPCLRKLEVRSSVWFYSELGPLYQVRTNESAALASSLSALRFCDTNVGSEAWAALRNALPSMAALRSLRLTQELQRPGQAFFDEAPDDDPEAFPALIADGIAAITALTELELTRTRARDIVDALPALGIALAHLHRLQRLTFAQSSSTDGAAFEQGALASEQDMLTLAACIFTLTQLTLLELGIPTADTGDRCPGAQAVLRSLAQLPRLQRLALACSLWGRGAVGAADVALRIGALSELTALALSAPKVSKYRLDNYKIECLCGRRGVAALTGVRYLSLCGATRFNTVMARSLAACLRALLELTRLDLSQCGWSLGTEQDLEGAVCALQHLQDLVLCTEQDRLGHTPGAIVSHADVRAARALRLRVS